MIFVSNLRVVARKVSTAQLLDRKRNFQQEFDKFLSCATFEEGRQVMNILYTSVIERNAGWGAEVFVNDALRQQGHRTQCIDFKIHHRDLSRQFLQVDDFEAFLLQRGDWISLRVLDTVRRPRFFWASELVSRCRDQDRLFQ